MDQGALETLKEGTEDIYCTTYCWKTDSQIYQCERCGLYGS